MTNPLIPRAERLPASFKVEVHWQGETLIYATRNISDTGIFLITDSSERPPLGSVVDVRLQGNLGCGEEPPTLPMQVVRMETSGIGLRFVES